MRGLNNQTSRYNNQIIINNQIPITKLKFRKLIDYWLLKFGICLYLVSWLLVISQPTYAEAPPTPQPETVFLEMWNKVGYYDTNLERKRFNKILGRSEGKLGFNIFNYPLQAYVVYYGVASQDEAYWNNSVFAGAGARIIPFRDFQGDHWANAWLKGLKIYAETLSSTYFKNADQAKDEGLLNHDERYGVEIWHEWNLDNPDLSLPWAELWLNYSSRSTNFTAQESTSTVLYLQPRIGLHLSEGIGAYLLGDITSSDVDSYWLNIAAWGAGVRFEPWRTSGETNELFRKFKMFLEVAGVSYLKDKPALAKNEVESDVRFGVEFSYGR